MDPQNYILGFQSTEMKNRLYAIETFLLKLKHRPFLSDITQTDLKLKVMSYCIFLLRDSNPKIVNISFDCLSLLIEHNGEAFEPLNNIAFDLLISKFCDYKLSVRQKATEIMLSLISLMTLPVGYDRLMTHLTNENSRVKEHILYTIIKLQEKYGNQLKNLSNLISNISSLLNDQNNSVKTLAIDTLLKLSSIFGEDVLTIINSLYGKKPNQQHSLTAYPKSKTSVISRNSSASKDLSKSKPTTPLNNSKLTLSPKWQSSLSPTPKSPTKTPLRKPGLHSSVGPSFGPPLTPKSPYLKATKSPYLKTPLVLSSPIVTLPKQTFNNDNNNNYDNNNNELIEKIVKVETLRTVDSLNYCCSPLLNKKKLYITIDKLVLLFSGNNMIPVCPSIKLKIGDSIFKTHRHLYLKAETVFSDEFVLPIEVNDINENGVNVEVEVLVYGLDRTQSICIGKGELHLFTSGSLELDHYFQHTMSIKDDGTAEEGKLNFRLLLSDKCMINEDKKSVISTTNGVSNLSKYPLRNVINNSTKEEASVGDIYLTEVKNQFLDINIPESTVAYPTSLSNNNNSDHICDNSSNLSLNSQNSISSSPIDNNSRSPKRFVSPKIITETSPYEMDTSKYLSESDNETCTIQSKNNYDDDSTVQVSCCPMKIDSSSYIKVFVRVAPMSKVSKSHIGTIGCANCRTTSSKGCLTVLGKKQLRLSSSTSHLCDDCSNKPILNSSPSIPKSDKVFNFDEVFSERSTQEDVFNSVKNTISSSFDGFNSTIFTYGPANTGKTYTMYGDNSNPGLIPLTVKRIFDLKNDLKSLNPNANTDTVIEISFVEIYNNNFRNLLRSKQVDDSNSTTSFSQSDEDVSKIKKSDNSNLLKTLYQDNKIELHEDKHGQQYFTGSMGKVDIKVSVHSEEDVLRYLTEGMTAKRLSRKKGEEESAKSHTILTFYISKKTYSSEHIFDTKTVTGKLHMIDLASSDKISATKTKPSDSNEGSKISVNLSILALGEVLNRLSINSSIESKHRGEKNKFVNQSPSNKLMHIPYFNSKLTFFLKDSLGGNTKTTMITTLLPDRELYTQSLQSLTFASKALAVLNHAKPNRPKIMKSPSPTKPFRPKSNGTYSDSSQNTPISRDTSKSIDSRSIKDLTSSEELSTVSRELNPSSLQKESITNNPNKTSPSDQSTDGSTISVSVVSDKFDLTSCTSSITFEYELHELVSVNTESDFEYSKLYEDKDQLIEGISFKSDSKDGFVVAINPLNKTRLSPKKSISDNNTTFDDRNFDSNCSSPTQIKNVCSSSKQPQQIMSVIHMNESFHPDNKYKHYSPDPYENKSSTSSPELHSKIIRENFIVAEEESYTFDRLYSDKDEHFYSDAVSYVIQGICMDESVVKFINIESPERRTTKSSPNLTPKEFKYESPSNTLFKSVKKNSERSDNKESLINDKTDLVSCSSSITFDYELHELMSVYNDTDFDYGKLYEDKSDIVEGIVFVDKKTGLPSSVDFIDSKEVPPSFTYDLSYSQSNDNYTRDDLTGIKLNSVSSEFQFDSIYHKEIATSQMILNHYSPSIKLNNLAINSNDDIGLYCDSSDNTSFTDSNSFEEPDECSKNTDNIFNRGTEEACDNLVTDSLFGNINTISIEHHRGEMISVAERTVSYDKEKSQSSEQSDEFSLDKNINLRSGVSPSKERQEGLLLNSFIKRSLSVSQDGIVVPFSPKKLLEQNEISCEDNTTVVDSSNTSFLQKERCNLFDIKQRIKYEKALLESLKSKLREELENLTLLRRDFSDIGYDEYFSRESFFASGIENHLMRESTDEKYGGNDSDSDVEYDTQPIYLSGSYNIDDSFDQSKDFGKAMKIAMKSGRKQEYKSYKFMEKKVSKETELLCIKELREIEEVKMYKTEKMIIKEESKYLTFKKESDKVTSLKLLNSCHTKYFYSLSTVVKHMAEEIDLLRDVTLLSSNEFIARRKTKSRAKAIQFAILDSKNEAIRSPIRSCYKQLLFNDDLEENKVSPTKSILQTSQIQNYTKNNLDDSQESRVNSSIDSYDKKFNSSSIKKGTTTSLEKKSLNISEFFHVDQSLIDSQIDSNNPNSMSSLSLECRCIEETIQSSRQVLNELNEYLLLLQS